MYFAAAAMTLASCGKEEIKPAEPETPGVIKVRFGAEAPITKAVATDDDLNFESTWIDEEDAIGVTSYDNGSVYEDNALSIWYTDAFETTLSNDYTPEKIYQFKGVYPYSENGTVDFGATREQTLGNQNGMYDIMVSSTISSVLPAENKLVLPMERQTATVYFHLKSELDEVVKSATLITEDGKWIAASTATLNHNGFSAPGDEYQIKLNILEQGANKMSTKDMQFWFNVLPVSETSLTLLVETETHSFTMSKKSKNTNWEAGHLYTTVIKDIPAEKWAEIERPAGVKTETITLSEFDNTANEFSVVTFKTSDEIVSASFNKGTASNKPAWVSEQVRLYPGSNLTIVASNNQTIKSITYNAVINANKNDIKPTIRIDGTPINDGDPLEWAGDKQSVVLSVGGSAGNIGFTSIDVTYTDPNGSIDPIYKYSVMVDKNVTNGTITVDKTSAKEGDEVTITATPSDGYELVAGSVKAYNAVLGAELTVTNNKFTMPAANVNVTAQFSLIPTLSATSPDAYASNLTNNSGAGFSIPVTANQAWVAAIKDGDSNDADITLMTAEGEGGENNNLVFKFNSQNTSPLAAKSTVVVLSPKNGNRPEPVEITITHEKRGATLVLNDDDKANITANVLAKETSYTVKITNANFSEWSVLEYKIGDDAQSTSDANCVTTHDDGANTGSVTIVFPANASESNDVTITLKIGYEGIITKTLTLTQAAAAARTPNVTLDFTDNTNWGFPEGSSSKLVEENTYSSGDYSVTLVGGGDTNGYYFLNTPSSGASKSLLIGKKDATLTFNAFDFDVDRIKIYGNTGASTSVKQNIYVGETAVSTETTGATTTNTYEIGADYQAAGNVYVLKITSGHNTQITKIEIFGGAPKTVTSVEVSGTPTNKSYEVGEVFNPAGLKVTANYDDGSSKVVTTGITWTDGNGNELAGLTEGTTSVTVKAVYKDIPSAAFTVNGLTVTAPKVLDHITVKTTPKVTYDAGDKFDPTNLVITKHFTDSSVEDVEYNSNTASAFTFNPSTSTSLTTSNTSVRITYGGKYCDLTITVNTPSSLDYKQTFDYANGPKASAVNKKWDLTNYTDQDSYYQVPTGKDVTTSVATLAGVFSGKKVTTAVTITINSATYGSGTNPSESTFKIYKESACSTEITAIKSGTLPKKSTYTDVIYTVSKEEAAKFVDDLVIKITKPGKTIRLKSITVKFSYSAE